MTELLTDALALLDSWGWTSLPFWAKALSGTVAGYVAFRVASDVCRIGWRLVRWTGAPAVAKAWWRKPPAWQKEIDELRERVIDLAVEVSHLRYLPPAATTAPNGPFVLPQPAAR